MLYSKLKVDQLTISAPALSWRPSLSLLRLLLPSFALFVMFATGQAQYAQPPDDSKPQNSIPPMLRNIGIDQKLNTQVPLDISFRDETGIEAPLSTYFGKKPVILTLVYYSCPMLCNQVLNGVVGSLEGVPFNIGKEFDVVTVSFDKRETPAQAAEKKQTYLRRYGNIKDANLAAAGWHFLTGDQDSIDRLTKAVGFRYAFDPQTNQFAHASGIMILTPEGRLSRYFYGIEYAPRDMRLGLVEASEGKIGSSVDQLLLFCYHYDPASGTYGAAIVNIVRVAGILTVIGIVCLILFLRRRTPRFPKQVEVGGSA